MVGGTKCLERGAPQMLKKDPSCAGLVSGETMSAVLCASTSLRVKITWNYLEDVQTSRGPLHRADDDRVTSAGR